MDLYISLLYATGHGRSVGSMSASYESGTDLRRGRCQFTGERMGDEYWLTASTRLALVIDHLNMTSAVYIERKTTNRTNQNLSMLSWYLFHDNYGIFCYFLL